MQGIIDVEEIESGNLYLFRPKIPNSSFLIDVNLASELADIHRENRIHAVFFGTLNKYPLSRHYCLENKTRPIEVVSAVDLTAVFNYIQGGAKNLDFGYIPHDRFWSNMGKLQDTLNKFGRKIIEVNV